MADDSLERITILLQAKDRDFARAMERNNKLVAKFAREAAQGTTAATRSIDANLARAGASAMNFGKSFVTGLAVGAITAIFAEVSGSIRTVIGDLADLQDAANRINMGVEEMQALQYGMKLAGVQADEFSSSMEKFVINIGDAARGSGKLREIMDANGISIKDMSGAIRPTADILRDFADLIRRTDESARMSLVEDAFGKSGKAMVLAMENGSFGLNQMEQDAYKAGAVLDAEVIAKAAELDDKFDALTARIGVFFKTIAVNTADAVSQIGNVATAADQAMQISTGGREDQIISSEDQAALQLAGDVAFETSQQLEQLTGQYLAMADAAYVASDQLLETAAQLRLVGDEAGADRLQALATEMNRVAAEFVNGEISGEKFQDKLGDVYAASQDAVHGLDAVDGVSFSSVIARLGGLWTALQNVATKAREAAAAMPGGSPGFESGGRGSPRTPNTAPPSFESGGRSGSTSTPYVAPAQTLQDIIDRNAGSGSGSAGGSGGAADRMNDQQREAARLFEQTRTEAEKYAAELLELNELLADGYIDQDLYARGLEQIKEKYGEAGGAAEFFKDTNADLKSAFLDLAIDGVDSFDAIAKSIKRAALEALLFGSGPLAEIFGGKSGGKGGGFLSGFASLFKGKRAAGGSVTAGGAYMVGERGPELYVPGASGAIVPHSKISGGGGQGPLSVQIGFDGSIGSFTAMVRDEAGRVVAMATPQIVSQSVGAVVSMSKKTKSALS